MKLRRVACVLAAVVVLAPATAGADRWVMNGEVCEREWTARSLARGPFAMGNGVLMPFRSFYGGLAGGWWAALMSPLGLMVGLAEGISWTVVGAFDLVSGGAFALAPEGAADTLHFHGVVQFPLGRRSLDEYRVDGCERGT